MNRAIEDRENHKIENRKLINSDQVCTKELEPSQ
jgi:hypothetical protein